METAPASSTVVILIVEDEPLRPAALKDEGFQVLQADNADAAVSIMEARSDMLIGFTDIDMPGSMDGITLAGAPSEGAGRLSKSSRRQVIPGLSPAISRLGASLSQSHTQARK